MKSAIEFVIIIKSVANQSPLAAELGINNQKERRTDQQSGF